MSRDTREIFVVQLIDLLTVLISKLGPWLLGVAAAYYIRGSIIAVMHEETLAPAWMKMMTSVNQVRVFGFIFGLLGLAYGIKERELRRAAEDRLKQRTPELEHSHDLDKAVPAHEECAR